MRGFEDRKRVLGCDRAGAAVRLEYGDAKCSLPQPWTDELRLAEAFAIEALVHPFDGAALRAL